MMPTIRAAGRALPALQAGDAVLEIVHRVNNMAARNRMVSRHLAQSDADRRKFFEMARFVNAFGDRMTDAQLNQAVNALLDWGDQCRQAEWDRVQRI